MLDIIIENSKFDIIFHFQLFLRAPSVPANWLRAWTSKRLEIYRSYNENLKFSRRSLYFSQTLCMRKIKKDWRHFHIAWIDYTFNDKNNVKIPSPSWRGTWMQSCNSKPSLRWSIFRSGSAIKRNKNLYFSSKCPLHKRISPT